MRVIVTGTGRCGTGYVAQVLTVAGHDCTHEAVFAHHGPQPERWQAISDSSWMAVPHLDEHPEAVVLLPYRSPQAVIGSFLGLNFYTTNNVYRDYMFQHLPALAAMTPLDAACHQYAWWNLTALTRANIVFDVADPPWDRISNAVGIPQVDLVAAAGEVSTSYNHRRRIEPAADQISAAAHSAHHALRNHTDGVY